MARRTDPLVNEAAAVIFSRYRDGGHSFVANIPELSPQPDFEALHLDFKLKATPGTVRLEKEDKRNLAAALSGFGNSDGGVIVWGVDARRSDEGYDRVVGVRELADPVGVAAEMTQYTSEATSFAVEGVLHEPLVGPDGSGFVVTLVPRSPLSPHMARGPGQLTYYQRVGASFRPMEHFQVADMFGRRPQPKVEASWSTPQWEFRGIRGIARLRVLLTISNLGRGLASNACLTVGQPTIKPDADVWLGALGVAQAPAGSWKRYVATGGAALYPGDTYSILSIAWDFSSPESIPEKGLIVRATAVSADSPEHTASLEITQRDLRERAYQILSEAAQSEQSK